MKFKKIVIRKLTQDEFDRIASNNADNRIRLGYSILKNVLNDTGYGIFANGEYIDGSIQTSAKSCYKLLMEECLPHVPKVKFK